MKPTKTDHEIKFAKYYQAVKECKDRWYALIVSDLYSLWDTIDEVQASIAVAREKKVAITLAWLSLVMQPFYSGDKE